MDARHSSCFLTMLSIIFILKFGMSACANCLKQIGDTRLSVNMTI
jgi:hypothetical protein